MLVLTSRCKISLLFSQILCLQYRIPFSIPALSLPLLHQHFHHYQQSSVTLKNTIRVKALGL